MHFSKNTLAVFSCYCFTLGFFSEGFSSNNCSYGGGNACETNSCSNTGIPCDCNSTYYFTYSSNSMCASGNAYTVGTAIGASLDYTLCIGNAPGGAPAFGNGIGGGATTEFGPVMYNTVYGQTITWDDDNGGDDTATLWISNPSNYFNGAAFNLTAGNIQIGTTSGENTIDSVSSIALNGSSGNSSGLFAPYGATFSGPVTVSKQNLGKALLGGGGSTAPLILTGSLSFNNGTSSNLQIYSGWVRLAGVASGSGLVYIGNSNTGLQITGQSALGTATSIYLNGAGGTLQFYGTGASMTFVNSFYPYNPNTVEGYSVIIDTHSNSVDWQGSINCYGLGSQITFQDSLGTGFFNFFPTGSAVSDSSIVYVLRSGTLAINVSTVPNFIYLLPTGSFVPLLGMPEGTYENIVVGSGTSAISFSSSYHQTIGTGGGTGLSGTGSVNIYASVEGAAPVYLNGGTSFTGTIIAGGAAGSPTTFMNIDMSGLGNSGENYSLILNPTGSVTFTYGGALYANISSAVPVGGTSFPPSLFFSNENAGVYLTSAIDTGSLLITMEEGSFGLYTEGYPVTAALNVNEGVGIDSSSSTLTFVNAGPDGSFINGTIEGGNVQISSSNGVTLETVSGGSAASLTFSTLSLNTDAYDSSEQGVLKVYAQGILGTSGTIVGNGGALSNAGVTLLTIPNSLQFVGGKTTSFLTSSSGPITMTGSVSVTGSGSAILEHTGSGTLTLDFSSLTIATGASLVTNGNSLTVSVLENSGTGDLILGASRNITDTLTVSGGSFSGVISDANTSQGAIGAVSIGTAGDVTLGGVNTFSGGVTLGSLATLSVASSGSLGSGTITSYGGSVTTLSPSQTLVNSLTLETVSGTATTAFTGGWVIESPLLSVTGGTGTAVLTVSGGTITPSYLNIAFGATLTTQGQAITIGGFSGNSSSGGTLALGGATGVNGVFTVTSGTASTFAGNITDGSEGGVGIVIIEAPVTFSGNNTFSGGLTLNPSISSGTSVLTINSGSAFGIGTATGNGGALATESKASITLANPWIFNNTTTTTYNVGTGGILNLTGALSISASGTAYLVKTGSGTLEIDGSSLSSGTYEITCSNGTVIYQGEGSTMASVFLHDGIFRGEETFFAIAPATVSDWSFQRTFLDPTVTDVSVAPGAIFAGLGSITSADVQGAFAAGGLNAFGVLTVASDLVFESGSYFLVPIDAVSGSLVQGEGPVQIEEGSLVKLLPRAGAYVPSEHIILTYDTLGGSFTSVESPSFYLFRSSLNYSVPGQISVIVEPLSVTNFIGNNQNAFEVAKALDTVVEWNRTNVSVEIPSGAPDPVPLLPDLLDSLTPFLTEPGMTEAINELQSSFFAGVTVTSENTAVLVRSTVSGRTDYLLDTQGCFSFGSCCERKTPVWEGWISGVGEVISQDSDRFAGSPQPGYLSKTGGFVAGLDGRFFEGCYLGAFGGYTDSFTRWYEGRGQANRKAGHVGLYVSASGKQFFGNVSILGSFGNVSTKRYIEYPGVDLVANGRFADKQLLTHADTGVNLVFGGFTIRPFDSLDYVAGAETGYTETEAGEWDLTVARKNAILLRNELGLKLAASFCHHGMRWTIEPKAGWVREVRIKGGDFVTSFVEAEKADAPFVVTGYFPDRSLFSPGVSITGSTLCDRLQVRVFYNGVFGGGYEDHAYGGDIRFGF